MEAEAEAEYWGDVLDLQWLGLAANYSPKDLVEHIRALEEICDRCAPDPDSEEEREESADEQTANEALALALEYGRLRARLEILEQTVHDLGKTGQ